MRQNPQAPMSKETQEKIGVVNLAHEVFMKLMESQPPKSPDDAKTMVQACFVLAKEFDDACRTFMEAKPEGPMVIVP